MLREITTTRPKRSTSVCDSAEVREGRLTGDRRAPPRPPGEGKRGNDGGAIASNGPPRHGLDLAWTKAAARRRDASYHERTEYHDKSEQQGDGSQGGDAQLPPEQQVGADHNLERR